MVYNTWTCKDCGLVTKEVEHDYDCHAYRVYKNNELIGTVYPDNVNDSDDAREQLNNGECPDCSGWEITYNE